MVLPPPELGPPGRIQYTCRQPDPPPSPIHVLHVRVGEEVVIRIAGGPPWTVATKIHPGRRRNQTKIVPAFEHWVGGCCQQSEAPPPCLPGAEALTGNPECRHPPVIHLDPVATKPKRDVQCQKGSGLRTRRVCFHSRSSRDHTDNPAPSFDIQSRRNR